MSMAVCQASIKAASKVVDGWRRTRDARIATATTRTEDEAIAQSSANPRDIEAPLEEFSFSEMQEDEDRPDVLGRTIYVGLCFLYWVFGSLVGIAAAVVNQSLSYGLWQKPSFSGFVCSIIAVGASIGLIRWLRHRQWFTAAGSIGFLATFASVGAVNLTSGPSVFYALVYDFLIFTPLLTLLVAFFSKPKRHL